MDFDTAPFIPGGLDPRELGVKLISIAVNGVDVTEKTLFEQGAYGPDGSGAKVFRWTRPSGYFHLPLPADTLADPATAQSSRVTFTFAGPDANPVTFRIGGAEVTETASISLRHPATAELDVNPSELAVDMINNVGGLVFVNGAGADRGFEEVDRGQFDEQCEVFTACGNGMAVRTARGAEVGWFDDRYFMYYEDVDLSWRLRARGGRILYVPDSGAATHPLGEFEAVVPRLALSRRTQPTDHPDQERRRPPGRARGGAVPRHHREGHPACVPGRPSQSATPAVGPGQGSTEGAVVL